MYHRLLNNLGRVGAPPVAAGVAAAAHARSSPPQAQNNGAASSSAKLAMEEHEGFLHVSQGFEAPMQLGEVQSVLIDLAAGGGAVPRRAPALSSAPLIEEVDGSESDASSVGSAANGLMASVDGSLYHEAPEGGGSSSSSALELLAATVTNVLNQPEVVDAITRHLRSDPAFAALLEHSNSVGPPARWLTIEELQEEPEAEAEAEGAQLWPVPEGRANSGNPMEQLLRGINRGVALAAVRVGEAFCHVGNFLRGLGEHLRLALAGMEDGDPASHPQPGGLRTRRMETAVMQVACAVAVMVLTRRVALGRMVVA